MSIHRSLLAALAALLLAAVAASAQQADTSRIFEDKSGMVEMKMSMMGMNPTMTLYFDDYGRKTATVVQVKVGRTKMVQHAVVMGDTTYSWDEQRMEGTKAARTGNDQMSLTSYMNMSDARKRGLNYRELDARTVAGKTAVGFSIDTSTVGGAVSMKIWHWHNIPMYMEATSQGATVTFTATKISVPGKLPKNVFTLPKGMKFEEPQVYSPFEEEPEDGSFDGTTPQLDQM